MIAGLGAAHFADGQYAEAAERMCKASDLSPKETAPYMFLGELEKAIDGFVGLQRSTAETVCRRGAAKCASESIYRSGVMEKGQTRTERGVETTRSGGIFS